MEARPIPAFYAVYLLRSTQRSTSLYIGSTPHPRRRLLQHNGAVVGGAARTRGGQWDMVCLVQGFPSSVAALQFEWTWQNPHLTRRIPAEARITQPRATTVYSARTGRPRKRPARPPISLPNRLANLGLLLRVPSFARWPLRVRFFDAGVYDVWRSKVAGAEALDAVLDVPAGAPPSDGPTEVVAAETAAPAQRKRRKKSDAAPPRVVHEGGIDGLDRSYRRLRPGLEKARFRLAAGESVACAVCAAPIHEREFAATLLCPADGCEAASHLTCLAQRFLERETTTHQLSESPIVPTRGECPKCAQQQDWVDLVSSLSLRMRDPELVDKILQRRSSAGKSAWRSAMVVPDSEESGEDGPFEDEGLLDEDDAVNEDDPVEDYDPLQDDDIDQPFWPEGVIDEPLSYEADTPDEDLATNVDESAERGARNKARPVFRMPPQVEVGDRDM